MCFCVPCQSLFENCHGATYGGVYNVVGLVLLCTDIPKPSLLAIAELLVVKKVCAAGTFIQNVFWVKSK